MESLEDGTIERLARLRDRLEAGILAIAGTGVNGAGAPRTANTTNISFEQVEGEALVIALDLKGVAVSGGSACHSGVDRAEPRADGDGTGQERGAGEPALQFVKDGDRCGCGLCAESGA